MTKWNQVAGKLFNSNENFTNVLLLPNDLLLFSILFYFILNRLTGMLVRHHRIGVKMCYGVVKQDPNFRYGEQGFNKKETKTECQSFKAKN